MRWTEWKRQILNRAKDEEEKEDAGKDAPRIYRQTYETMQHYEKMSERVIGRVEGGFIAMMIALGSASEQQYPHADWKSTMEHTAKSILTEATYYQTDRLLKQVGIENWRQKERTHNPKQ